jgi:ATP-dependent DNA helicase RecG
VKAAGVARKFEKLGLRSRFDFVLHLPLRYEDETTIYAPAQAPQGRTVSVDARVLEAKVEYRGRRQLTVRAEGLVLRFFNFYGSQAKQFQRAADEGLWVRAFGEVRGGLLGVEMFHPRYRLMREPEPAPRELTPIYPTTAGLKQGDLRARILSELDAGDLADSLPDDLRRKHGLQEFAQSARLLHRPPPGIDLQALAARTHPAWQRMKFDELLAQQLSMRFSYRERRARTAPSMSCQGPLLKAFMKSLPFRLTRAQARALNQVLADLREAHPMQRLLQGDVGSGKTIVAAIACLAAVDDGWQAAVMAPTEILAEQHVRRFREWFAPLGLDIGWLHGGVPKRARKAQAAAPLVVGTHALIQDGVDLARLGLAIVDEQHRFGVRQRLTLRRKADDLFPHQLMMSATPIPRTLAMTAYADLDVSVIDELPPGRRPVTTKLIAATKRGKVLDAIREACAGGQQAYWVCPVIEESKDGDVQTAIDTHALLTAELKEVRVGLVHGRLPAAEKAAVMKDFLKEKVQLLVCTTVIEVGVDVPNASLMVIESAERFGLAQLHQLRGRIGRGARASACILLYGAPLSQNARARLKAIYENADGFRVAELDLELRGQGEFLGERQSGDQLFRFADLLQDQALLAAAQAAAHDLIERRPGVARAHVTRWLESRQDLTQA